MLNTIVQPQKGSAMTADTLCLFFLCRILWKHLSSILVCVELPYILRHTVSVCMLIKGGTRVCSVRTLCSSLWSVGGNTWLRIKGLQWWLSDTGLLTCWDWVGQACSPALCIISAVGYDCVLGQLFLIVDSVLPPLAPGSHCSFQFHHTQILPLREIIKGDKANRTTLHTAPSEILCWLSFKQDQVLFPCCPKL